MALQIRRGQTRSFGKMIAASFAVMAIVLQPLVQSNIPAAFAADNVISIDTTAELRDAIENQQDGQTWNIAPGNYEVTRTNAVTAGGQTGWYLPIVADNLTINGAGANQTTVYGSGYTANGNWSTQDFIAIFGDNVTLNNFTVMSKVAGNKAIEVIGADSTITNVKVTPNTISMSDYASIATPGWADWYQRWAGSIYYNHATGVHALENVAIYNGGVSNHGSVVSTNNVAIHNTFDDIYEADSFYGNAVSEGGTTSGAVAEYFHLNGSTGNVDNTVAALTDDAIMVVDSDLTLNKELTITKAVTIEGNGHTITGTFDKGGSNAAVLHFKNIATGHSQVNNLIVDGGNHDIHGIQMYNSDALTTLWRVTVKNNGRSGVNVNDSYAQIVDLTTENSGWHGVDVDKGSAKLLVAGQNHFNEGVYPVGTPHANMAKPDIYVDELGAGAVVFSTSDLFGGQANYLDTNDYAYFMVLTAPTLLTPSNGVTVNGASVTNSWSAINGAVAYEYQSFNSADTTKTPRFTDTYASTSKNAVDVQDGTVFYWRVRAIDADGVKGQWSDLWSVKVDSAAPAKPIGLHYYAVGDAKDYTQNNLSVKRQAVYPKWDAVTKDVDGHTENVDHYNYESKGGYATTINSTDASENSTIKNWVPPVDVNDGFRVQAVDKAGNVGEWSDWMFFDFDSTAPEILIDTSIDGQVLRGPVSVHGSVNDAHPHHYYVLVTKNGATVSAHTYNSLVNFAGILATVDGDGVYKVILAARDAVGGTGVSGNRTGDISVTFTIDNTAPVVKVTGASLNDQGTYTINGTTDDPTSPVTVTVDGTLLTGLTLNGNNWTVNTGVLLDGDHVVVVTSADTAGNKTTETYAFKTEAGNATIDNVNGDDNGDGPLNNGTPAADADDGEGDVAGASDAKQGTVEGASTTKNADDAAKTSGTASWFWWILAAAAASFVWWLIAAVRKRKSEE